MSDHLAKAALKLLQSDPEVVADARIGAPLGNSVAGSILSLTYQAPRQYAEAAVRQALKQLDGGAA